MYYKNVYIFYMVVYHIVVAPFLENGTWFFCEGQMKFCACAFADTDNTHTHTHTHNLYLSLSLCTNYHPPTRSDIIATNLFHLKYPQYTTNTHTDTETQTMSTSRQVITPD